MYKPSKAYKRLIQWLEVNDEKMPRPQIIENGKQLTTEEMSSEDAEERRIYRNWFDSKEYKVLKACEGIPLDKMPEEYAEYKRSIETLRSYGLGVTFYEKMIDWLSDHDGKMPRADIIKGKRRLSVAELSKEEQIERNLYRQWIRSPEREAFESCKDIPLDEIPDEYAEYKDKIAELRKYEQMRKERRALRMMRRSVGRQIGNNEYTRAEIAGLSRQMDARQAEQK